MATIKNDPYGIFTNHLTDDEMRFVSQEEKSCLKNYPFADSDKISQMLFLKLQIRRLSQEYEQRRRQILEKKKRRGEARQSREKLADMIRQVETIVEQYHQFTGLAPIPEKIYPKKLREFVIDHEKDKSFDEQMEKLWPYFLRHSRYCTSINSEEKRKESEAVLNVIAYKMFS